MNSETIKRMTDEEIVAHNRREMARRDEREKQGYVYFLRAGDTVKIGFSRNLRRRLEKLRNGNAFPVFICKYVKGDCKTERAFHKRFAEYRIRGEWFDLRGALAKYLERHIYPVELPEPVSDDEPEVVLIL